MLTELEDKILKFIGEYLRENDGRSPTLAEIGSGCGINSVGTIHRYVASIEKKGFLDKARSGWRTLLTPTELPFRGVIAAGRPIEAIEQSETFDLSSLIQPDCFILKVKGDSMIDAGILEDDMVVIRSSTTARNGEIIVALLDGEDASLKEFKNNGQQIELIPHNSEMKPMIYDTARIQIQGVLTSVIRTYRRT